MDCPTCKTTIDGAFGPEPPTTGDYSLCAHCRTLLAFTSSGALVEFAANGVRVVPSEEFDAMPPEFKAQIEKCRKVLGGLVQ